MVLPFVLRAPKKAPKKIGGKIAARSVQRFTKTKDNACIVRHIQLNAHDRA